MNRQVVIIGGGLAGLIGAILLNRNGFQATVIEKKIYPFHRVCGEYLSNEVLPFLQTLSIDVARFNPSHISKLTLSGLNGETIAANLDLGGFGISRYTFDNLLHEKAQSEGVNFLLGTKVHDVRGTDEKLTVYLSDNTHLYADWVIGAYGKRSNLDHKFQRNFFYKRSPFIGVKYHIKTDMPHDVIQLDNFEGGYCGTVKIEDDKYCLCYLAENKNLKHYGSVSVLEEEVLYKNPQLKQRFLNSDFLFNKPEVINEISFEQKPLVENHILFCGDAAGMIAPLCGNGMAMAIHSGKLLAEIIIEHAHTRNREFIENIYMNKWQKTFARRLKTGRFIQKMMQNKQVSNLMFLIMNRSSMASNFIIGLTHGKPFL